MTGSLGLVIINLPSLASVALAFVFVPLFVGSVEWVGGLKGLFFLMCLISRGG